MGETRVSVASKGWSTVLNALSLLISITALVVSVLVDANDIPYLRDKSRSATIETFTKNSLGFSRRENYLAVAATSPDSPAFRYLQSRIGVFAALTQAGEKLPTKTWKAGSVERQRVKVCSDKKTCVEYADFAFDNSNKIVDFTIEGRPVTDYVAEKVGDYEAGKFTPTFTGILHSRMYDYLAAGIQIQNQSDRIWRILRLELLDDRSGTSRRIAPSYVRTPKRVGQFQVQTIYAVFRTKARSGWVAIYGQFRNGTYKTLWLKFGPATQTESTEDRP